MILIEAQDIPGTHPEPSKGFANWTWLKTKTGSSGPCTCQWSKVHLMLHQGSLPHSWNPRENWIKVEGCSMTLVSTYWFIYGQKGFFSANLSLNQPRLGLLAGQGHRLWEDKSPGCPKIKIIVKRKERREEQVGNVENTALLIQIEQPPPNDESYYILQ